MFPHENIDHFRLALIFKYEFSDLSLKNIQPTTNISLLVWRPFIRKKWKFDENLSFK